MKTIDKEAFYKIKQYLEEKGIASIDGGKSKMQLRAEGKEFSFRDHIQGHIYSMLSAQMKWEKIENNREGIDELFFHYNPEEIKNHDYQYFVDGLGRMKCRNRLTNAMMKALAGNVKTMERIVKDYGSMDSFVTSAHQEDIVRMLSENNSPYKLRQIGPALAWEYLRNVGVDGAKPDVHMKRILGCNRLGVSESETASDAEVLESVRTLSKETGIWMADIDYLIWSYCADGKGEICTASPKCHECVISEFCNYKILSKP